MLPDSSRAQFPPPVLPGQCIFHFLALLCACGGVAIKIFDANGNVVMYKAVVKSYNWNIYISLQVVCEYKKSYCGLVVERSKTTTYKYEV